MPRLISAPAGYTGSMTQLRTPPVSTAFELDELRMEHDRVVVRGRWSGTRGMRFVRPTLLVGGREVLASLDHKPWAPDEGAVWTAAFPWEGPVIAPGDAALAVTPAVTVPLVQDERRPEPPVPASAEPPAAAVRPSAPSSARRTEDELADVRRRLERVEAERDEGLAINRRLRDDLEQAEARRRSAEGELESAVADRRRAEMQRDDAVAEGRRSEGWAEQQDRHVKVVQEDAARLVADRDAALAARREAEQERDDAIRRSAQAREARDEALVAYRALERRLRVGEEDGESAVQPEDVPDIPSRDEQPAGRDEPLGVVAVPAARDLAADVHHVDRLSERPVTAFDMWAVRILGSVAACCFLGLMLLLMLTFT